MQRRKAMTIWQAGWCALDCTAESCSSLQRKMFSETLRGTGARHQFWIISCHRGHLKRTKDPPSSSYLSLSGWKEELGRCGAEMFSQCWAGEKEAAGQASRGKKRFQRWAACFCWYLLAAAAHILGLWLCSLGSGECERTMHLKRVFPFGLWTLWVRPLTLSLITKSGISLFCFSVFEAFNVQNSSSASCRES